MKRNMIKATNPTNNATIHIVLPAHSTNEMIDCLRAVNADVVIKVFELSKMPLEELPVDIQEKAKDVLKAFDNVNVVFEYNRFEVSASCCIKSHYNYDHFVCGRYSAKDVYTEEERRQNYIESFGC